MRTSAGLTIVELLFTITLLVTLTVLALPWTKDAVDERRAAMAARYLSGAIFGARVMAVTRSAAVGLRFEPSTGDYYFASVLDGNENGIRAADIRDGIDRPLTSGQRLRDKFPGVSFAIQPGVPDLNGVNGGLRDGVRIGTARILTLSPNGTATSGTLYVSSRKGQYAVRILGATGRTRVLQYRPGEQAWVSR